MCHKLTILLSITIQTNKYLTCLFILHKSYVLSAAFYALNWPQIISMNHTAYKFFYSGLNKN